MHQLGERQRVGGGPAAAAHRLQRDTRQVRGAHLAGCSAVQEQLARQREGNGHLGVKYVTHAASGPPPHWNKVTQLNISAPPHPHQEQVSAECCRKFKRQTLFCILEAPPLK